MEARQPVDPAKPPPAEPAAAGARRLLVAGACVVVTGVALVGTDHPVIGGPVLMAGWLVLAGGIHRFGRGPDLPPA